jgi:hypothetical protein
MWIFMKEAPVSLSLKKSTLLLAMMSLVACGKGFQNSGSSATDLAGQTTPGTVGSTPNPALSQIAYQGIQSQGADAGRVILELDRINENVVVILPLPSLVLGFIGQVQAINIPSLPGAQFIPRQDGNLAVSIPLKYVVRDGQFQTPGTQNSLPNGDPLPGFPSKEGAEFGLDLNGSYKVHLYFGVKAVGVFIETPGWDSYMNCQTLNLPICFPMGPWAVNNATGNEILGYVSFVYAKGVYHSGAFVSTIFTPELARFIDDHIKY